MLATLGGMDYDEGARGEFDLRPRNVHASLFVFLCLLPYLYPPLFHGKFRCFEEQMECVPRSMDCF